MALVSISRGSNSRGTEVAEKVAERLGYTCLARETLLKASDWYNIPENELVRAIEDPPSFVERLTGGKSRYMATIRATLLNQLKDDKIVYHGFAGHYFLRDIRHTVKARILAEMSDRVATLVERDGLSEKKARQTLMDKDKARRRLAQHLYGIDPEDPSLYDIVLHVGKMGTDGAAEVICNLARSESFTTTPESQTTVENLALTASVEAVLVDMEIELTAVEVAANHGVVTVLLKEAPRTRAGSSSQFHSFYLDSVRPKLQARARDIPGLKVLHLENFDD